MRARAQRRLDAAAASAEAFAARAAAVRESANLVAADMLFSALDRAETVRFAVADAAIAAGAAAAQIRADMRAAIQEMTSAAAACAGDSAQLVHDIRIDTKQSLAAATERMERLREDLEALNSDANAALLHRLAAVTQAAGDGAEGVQAVISDVLAAATEAGAVAMERAAAAREAARMAAEAAQDCSSGTRYAVADALMHVGDVVEDTVTALRVRAY